MFQPGQVLNNRYRIAKKLGEGGFGAVYRVWDLRMNGPCALKESFDTSPAARQQFEFEAQVLYKLNHPNLPRVYDYFLEGAVTPCLVMEFIEGENLAEKLIRAGRPLGESNVLLWTQQVCSALTYLHSQNPPVVHRDLKPENIILTPSNSVKLLDFGISKILNPAMRTVKPARAATPGYSPPEQYGQSGTDARSDIYSLGATLYTLLAAQEPPESTTLQSGLPLPPLQTFNSKVSSRVEKAISKAMAVKKENRYQDIETFKKALGVPSPQSSQQSINLKNPGQSFIQAAQFKKLGLLVKSKTPYLVAFWAQVKLILADPGGWWALQMARLRAGLRSHPYSSSGKWITNNFRFRQTFATDEKRLLAGGIVLYVIIYIWQVSAGASSLLSFSGIVPILSGILFGPWLGAAVGALGILVGLALQLSFGWNLLISMAGLFILGFLPGILTPHPRAWKATGLWVLTAHILQNLAVSLLFYAAYEMPFFSVFFAGLGSIFLLLLLTPLISWALFPLVDRFGFYWRYR